MFENYNFGLFLLYIIMVSTIFVQHAVTGKSLAAISGWPLRVFLVINEFLFFLAIAASFRRSSSSLNFAAFSAYEEQKINSDWCIDLITYL